MFPSIINTFNRPNSTDRLNSPSHSALHNTVSSALGQVQAVIGLSTSSAVGTIFYDVRSPDSNGGGHVQTAVKGGTGQTTYTKGDLLVAQSASVLSKLAVGADGTILTADSSVAGGVKWGTRTISPITKIATGVGSVLSGTLTGSIVSGSVPGSTLGTSGAIRTVAYINTMAGNATNASILVSAVYGNTRIASILILPPATIATSVQGRIEFTLIANNAVNAQRGVLSVNMNKTLVEPVSFTNPTSVIATQTVGSATEDSSAAKAVGLIARFSAANADDIIITNGYTVERII